MKQVLFILGGAAVVGLTAYLLLGQFANWYGPRYIQSDEDISTVFLIFLGVVAISAIAGGIGCRVLYRNLIFRAQGRADKRRAP
jgi:hypothetical protein